jgi:hypothetical protein
MISGLPNHETPWVDWTDEGIAFNARDAFGKVVVHNPADLLSDPDPLQTGAMRAIVVRWPELCELAAVDPWPRIRVVWSGPHGRSEEQFGPRGRSERFAAIVARLFDHVRRHKPDAVQWGWLAAPEVHWEQVARLPGDEREQRPSRGAYRTAAAKVAHETVLARREPPSPFEALLQWLQTRSFRTQPRELELTPEFLYGRRSDRTCWRLPLEHLRARIGEPTGDRSFVFGRHTFVVLPHREGCELTRALEQRLES